uniref:Glutamate--tRNA ligase n=1 Tax=Candidatus Kentrum sp. TUN TaxID=2126343 RepID=A0A450ZGW5_9GAMM|nr:MAG: glutamyl-tRNA synthetase [Candidatus Kentron sp. TUN]VFK53781.1 MAG: glutamyl-tRNA synthetase [Candidatus Kentron sp. TUN]VFK56508.1 MAG: glutamyl-tRNA synthetase [Candidatus Kentron sp. TUN]
MTTRTRFAPSPTGYLHVGGARTALFAWLYARRHGGEFILRIEDTDRERSSSESTDAILEGMAWLGLDYDEGPIFQSNRFDRYHEVIKRLLDDGHAYHCYCSRERLDAVRAEQMARKAKPRYDGHCRGRTDPPPADTPSVIRFRNPSSGETVVDDLVRGTVVFQNSELDDLIIARTDGSPTYHLTVVVDDIDMGITHVIRGDDHLNNTPRQINILSALGATPPTYAHVPMIMGADGQRLSKRHGAVSVMQYRVDGYLPEALLNYLVRLGWSYGDQEIFSLDEMVELFDVADVNHAASMFDPEKLLWLNQHYMKHMDPAHIARHSSWHMGQLGIDPSNEPDLVEVVMAQRERAKTLRELAENSRYFYEDFDGYHTGAEKHLTEKISGTLEKLHQRLMTIEDWSAAKIHEIIVDVTKEENIKLGKLAQPVRVAVTGRTFSPPIDITLELVGKTRTLQRIERAINDISERSTN